MKRSIFVDRTDPRTEGCEASCLDCDWHLEGGIFDHYGNTQKRVRHHVWTKNHRVSLKKTCVTLYAPRSGEPA